MFSTDTKTKKRKPIEIVGIVVIFVLLLAIVATFVIYGVFKDSNSAPKMLGHRVYIMNGDGMEPRIKKGAAVFVKEGELPNQGNVILCNIDGKLAVVGLVGSEEVIGSDGSVETRYLVKYDQGSQNEIWGIGESDIIGVAKTYSTFFGGIVNFASSKVGMLLIVIIPCAILIAYEAIMLVLANKNKRDNRLSDAVREEPEDPDEEIERLREEISRTRKQKEEKLHSEPSLEGTRTFSVSDFVSDKTDDGEIKLRFTSDDTTDIPEETPVELRKTQPEEPAKEEAFAKFEQEPVVDVTKMSYSDIDELIRMLEEEKKRLSEK